MPISNYNQFMAEPKFISLNQSPINEAQASPVTYDSFSSITTNNSSDSSYQSSETDTRESSFDLYGLEESLC